MKIAARILQLWWRRLSTLHVHARVRLLPSYAMHVCSMLVIMLTLVSASLMHARVRGMLLPLVPVGPNPNRCNRIGQQSAGHAPDEQDTHGFTHHLLVLSHHLHEVTRGIMRAFVSRALVFNCDKLHACGHFLM